MVTSANYEYNSFLHVLPHARKCLLHFDLKNVYNYNGVVYVRSVIFMICSWLLYSIRASLYDFKFFVTTINPLKIDHLVFVRHIKNVNSLRSVMVNAFDF